MNTIMTLCQPCANLLGEHYRVKACPKTTTELKTQCEQCRCKGRYVLATYHVQSK